MVGYRRIRVAGGTFFFTVNLRDRRRGLLVDYVDVLRHIVQTVRRELPFTIDTMVVLPDHWHAVWTMPPDDSGYAHQLRLIKARFPRHLLREGVSLEKDARSEYDLWSGDSGSTPFVTHATCRRMSIMCISIR